MEATQIMANNQSSGAVFLRAVIMLAFLAAIPLVALSGNSLPDTVRKAMEKYWPGIAGNRTETTASALSEAPPFAEAKSTDGRAESGHPALVKSPGNNEPGPFVIDPQSVPIPKTAQGGILSPQVPDGSVVPAKYQASGEPAARSAVPAAAGNEGLFLQIQKRLRALGATYYLLETWGNDQRFYRFYCQMAVADNTNYTRCFEATHADPIEAMRTVLTQVESWRSGAR
jgi:hypothetical protein